MVAGQQGSELH